MKTPQKYDVEKIIERLEGLEIKYKKEEEEIQRREDLNTNYIKNTGLTQASTDFRRRTDDESKVDEGEVEKLKRSDNKFKTFDNPEFELSYDRKSIVRKAGDGKKKKGFALEHKIEYEGTQEISYKIDASEAVSIFVGFMVDGTDLTNGAMATKTSWMCHLKTGNFNNSGTQMNSCFKEEQDEYWQAPKGCGDIITIYINTISDEVYLRKNGVKTKSCKIEITDDQKSQLVPCIDFRVVGDKISIY